MTLVHHLTRGACWRNQGDPGDGLELGQPHVQIAGGGIALFDCFALLRLAKGFFACAINTPHNDSRLETVVVSNEWAAPLVASRSITVYLKRGGLAICPTPGRGCRLHTLSVLSAFAQSAFS